MVQISLIYVETSKEAWAEAATFEYSKKINYYLPFQLKPIKSRNLQRREKLEKLKEESDIILEALDNNDFVILCDERGKQFNSLEFAKKLVLPIESGIKKIVIIIGGAFGVDDRVKKRAQLTWCLSGVTLSHLIARVLVLEQVYRAMTIWKGVPYHNE